MPLIDKARVWVGCGLVPNRKGFHLYEVEGNVFRVLAKFRGEEEMERFLYLSARGLKYERDLPEGEFHTSEEEIHGFKE